MTDRNLTAGNCFEPGHPKCQCFEMAIFILVIDKQSSTLSLTLITQTEVSLAVIIRVVACHFRGVTWRQFFKQ